MSELPPQLIVLGITLGSLLAVGVVGTTLAAIYDVAVSWWERRQERKQVDRSRITYHRMK